MALQHTHGGARVAFEGTHGAWAFQRSSEPDNCGLRVGTGDPEGVGGGGGWTWRVVYFALGQFTVGNFAEKLSVIS